MQFGIERFLAAARSCCARAKFRTFQRGTLWKAPFADDPKSARASGGVGVLHRLLAEEEIGETVPVAIRRLRCGIQGRGRLERVDQARNARHR
ncbi:MAG: hypothetical protein EBV06_17240, partial [Planctomycetia bacterium]|nr:hypothetical protein [Planctomycetia bacterium]